MVLKNRLDALRRQAGVNSDPPDPGADPPLPVSAGVADMPGTPEYREDLRSRLRRLGGRASPVPGPPVAHLPVDTGPPRRVGPSASARRPVDADASAVRLADRLGGQVVSRHVVLVETLLPLDARHGRRPLADALEPLWPLAALSPGARVLAIDTETTGLAGGTGTTAFMIGSAVAEPDGVRLRQWVLTAFAGEPAMLDALASSLAAADLVVSYNGKTFDLPLLRARRRLQRAPALPEPPHLDLLHPTRRLFRKAWSDCRLATSERRLLGLVREDDLPGSEAPRAWRDYLAGGPADDLAGVLRHNALDVLSLLALGPALARSLRDPLSCGADAQAAAAVWARCGERRRALTVLEGAREQLDTRGALELARALRSVGRLAEAVAIWERLAGNGSAEATERLAKYHEHVRRDWTRALDYARLLDEGAEARHRRRRLKRRLTAGQGRLDL